MNFSWKWDHDRIKTPMQFPKEASTNQLYRIKTIRPELNCIIATSICLVSGQIIIFHQPAVWRESPGQYFTNLDFPEIRGYFPSSATFWARSCEVAIIWPACMNSRTFPSQINGGTPCINEWLFGYPRGLDFMTVISWGIVKAFLSLPHLGYSRLWRSRAKPVMSKSAGALLCLFPGGRHTTHTANIQSLDLGHKRRTEDPVIVLVMKGRLERLSSGMSALANVEKRLASPVKPR